MHLFFLPVCAPVVCTLHEGGISVLVAATTQTCLVILMPGQSTQGRGFSYRDCRSPNGIILGFQLGKARLQEGWGEQTLATKCNEFTGIPKYAATSQNRGACADVIQHK